MPARSATQPAQAMREFAAWVRAVPERTNQPTTDGLFRFLAERYPCAPR